MAFKNYDPGLVIMSWRGILFTGFASGSMISAERMNDTFSMDVGSVGDVVRVRSRDSTGSVTVRLQASSPTNDLLSAVAVSDQVLGTGYGPLQIKNLNSRDYVTAAYAWIRKMPNFDAEDEASNREWVLDASSLYLYEGGAVI